MKIFVTGATGVIGRRLLPLLIAAGHQVTGMVRSARNARWSNVSAHRRPKSICSTFRP